MQKSIVSQEYQRFITHFREARKKTGLTQEEFAQRIGQTQSFVSKCERGERRIDVIELRTFCHALGIDFPKFIAALHQKLGTRR